MCQYSTKIHYFNIALVPAYRDALYLVEERNKGRPTADRWERAGENERGRVGGNAIWEEFASFENSRSPPEKIFEDRAGGDGGNTCE